MKGRPDAGPARGILCSTMVGGAAGSGGEGGATVQYVDGFPYVSCKQDAECATLEARRQLCGEPHCDGMDVWCESGRCVDGFSDTCEDLHLCPGGTSCQADHECTSGHCTADGTCEKQKIGEECIEDVECESGRCAEFYCAASARNEQRVARSGACGACSIGSAGDHAPGLLVVGLVAVAVWRRFIVTRPLRHDRPESSPKHRHQCRKATKSNERGCEIALYSRLMKAIQAVVAGLVLFGCGSTKMTPIGPTEESREPACEFEMFTAAPEGYREVGTIDVNPGGYGHNVFRKLDRFKEHIRPEVCAAGGDAAIALANGYGMYIKATVLKRNDEALATEQSTPPVADTDLPDEGSPEPTPTPADGCEYDTQCKGDRICTEGQCVDP